MADPQAERVYDWFTPNGGTEENVHFDLTFDEANLVRALLLQERNAADNRVNTYGVPANASAITHLARVKSSRSFIASLILRKF